jgi:hypothetical protein
VPAQFDLLYAICVAVCAIKELARPAKDKEESYEINNSLLKFGQFIAARPQLLEDYLEWRKHQSEGQHLDLQSWPLLPRGFLTDAVPDAVLAYLIAMGQLERQGKDITFRPGNHQRLAVLLDRIQQYDLFRSERRILAELARNRPTLTMLGVQ